MKDLVRKFFVLNVYHNHGCPKIDALCVALLPSMSKFYLNWKFSSNARTMQSNVNQQYCLCSNSTIIIKIVLTYLNKNFISRKWKMSFGVWKTTSFNFLLDRLKKCVILTAIYVKRKNCAALYAGNAIMLCFVFNVEHHLAKKVNVRSAIKWNSGYLKT